MAIEANFFVVFPFFLVWRYRENVGNFNREGGKKWLDYPARPIKNSQQSSAFPLPPEKLENTFVPSNVPHFSTSK